MGITAVSGSCPNNHRLVWNKTTCDNFTCGECKKEFKSTGVGERIGCVQCHYEVCSKCYKDDRARDVQVGGFEEGKKPGYIVVAKRGECPAAARCDRAEVSKDPEPYKYDRPTRACPTACATAPEIAATKAPEMKKEECAELKK